jgi:hypothetical protein
MVLHWMGVEDYFGQNIFALGNIETISNIEKV